MSRNSKRRARKVMDSNTGTGLDDHESFFESYEAEQALSLAPFEVENEGPSAEQLARAARFRKPVALFVSAMALFSLGALVSLRMHAAQPDLVARYNAALPAAAPSPVVEGAPAESAEAVSAVVPELTVSAADPEPEASASSPEPAPSAASPPSASTPSVSTPSAASPPPVSTPVVAPSAASPRSVSTPVVAPPSSASPRPVSTPVVAPSAASLAPSKRAGSEPSVAHVAAARSQRAPLASSVARAVATSPVVAVSKPFVAAPSSFNSVARFPDVQH